MGVYIKGMEMPKSCGDCPCLSETYCCCVDGVYPYDCNILIQETEEGAEFIGRLSNCPLVEAPKWIPVTERLPKEGEFVLVYGDLYPNKHDGGVIAVSKRIDWNYWQGFGRERDVTHWMPLPEPPKDGEA